MSYNELFSTMGLYNMYLKYASTYAITVSILAEFELLKKHPNVFNNTVLDKLSNQFELIENLAQVIEQNLNKDYSLIFTRGPRKNMKDSVSFRATTLGEAKLATLVRTLVDRLDYATKSLFRSDNYEEWDCDTIMFNNLGSVALSNFAREIKKFWFDITTPTTTTDEFAESFDNAFKDAASKSREEKEKQYAANSSKSKSTSPRNKFQDSNNSNELNKEPVQVLSLKNTKPSIPSENVWRKRMASAVELSESTNTDELQEQEYILKSNQMKSKSGDSKHSEYEQVQDHEHEHDQPNDLDDQEKTDKPWTVVGNKNKLVDIEVNFGGKRLLLQGKLLEDGTYKQVSEPIDPRNKKNKSKSKYEVKKKDKSKYEPKNKNKDKSKSKTLGIN